MTIHIPLPVLIVLGVIAALVFFAFLPPILMGLSEWNYARGERKRKREAEEGKRSWP